MSSLTAANSVFTLAIANLYPAPQILQGYASDDAFASDDLSPAEVMMGVDGKLSAGFVNVPVMTAITLSADSASCKLFDDWNDAQKSAKEIYRAEGIVILQGTGQKYSLSRGVLTTYSPMPGVKKILQPRKFVITWETSTPSPV